MTSLDTPFRASSQWVSTLDVGPPKEGLVTFIKDPHRWGQNEQLATYNNFYGKGIWTLQPVNQGRISISRRVLDHSELSWLKYTFYIGGY